MTRLGPKRRQTFSASVCNAHKVHRFRPADLKAMWRRLAEDGKNIKRLRDAVMLLIEAAEHPNRYERVEFAPKSLIIAAAAAVKLNLGER